MIELRPDGGEPAPLRLPEYRSTLNALVADALAQRPEMKRSDAQLSAARKARDGAKFGPLIPAVRGEYFHGGLGGGTYEDGVRRFDETSDYGVGLSWRVGSGGLFDRGRIHAGEARLQTGELEQEKVRDEITRQVVGAHARAHSLADQIEFFHKALSAAEQDLTRARLDYLTAITEHNRAQLALRRAVGNPARALKSGR